MNTFLVLSCLIALAITQVAAMYGTPNMGSPNMGMPYRAPRAGQVNPQMQRMNYAAADMDIPMGMAGMTGMNGMAGMNGMNGMAGMNGMNRVNGGMNFPMAEMMRCNLYKQMFEM